MTVLDLPATRLLSTAAAIAVATWLATFLHRLWRARTLFVGLKARGLPMPPHSFLLGHLVTLYRVKKRVPADLNRFWYIGDIMQDGFAERGAFYLDVWPFSKPMLIVTSPELAQQATVTNPGMATRRPAELAAWFKPFAGGPNLFDLPEQEWKPWRQLFSQGFGPTQNLSLVPSMVEKTVVFRDRLRKYAQTGELFQLEPALLEYTDDLMGRVVLNSSLDTYSGGHTLIDAINSQVAWHGTNREADPLQHLNFVRPFMQWRNGRVMDRFVGAAVDQRFAEHRAGRADGKSVIDMVLQAHLAEQADPDAAELDPAFRTFAIRQVRLFAFVGQSSLSATITYALHLLARNTAALTQLRAECDATLGPEPHAATAVLSEQPHLVNQLRFTRAVLKETCRLFPAASAIREGWPDTAIVGPDGTRYPTDGVLVWILHAGMQRAPHLWPHPEDFIPERWLVEPGHALYPHKGAWRPFEWGPRNCIGQDLAMVEMTVALVILARELDFQEAYAEWYERHPRKMKGPQTYRGEVAYQVEAGAARPVEGYPCRVTLRDGEAKA